MSNQNQKPLQTSLLTRTAVAIGATCALLTSANSAAGAWVPTEGSGYSKVGVQYYSADDFFGGNPDLNQFIGRNISYYGEYGLGENVAVYGSILAQDIEQSSVNGDVIDSSGFGDVEIGLRYQWQADPFVVSTSFLVKLPYLYDENDALPRGNGQEDYEGRILIGKSLNQYGYFGVELGYRFRAGDPSDEIRYLIEYGYSVNENLYLRTKLDGIESANNADSTTNFNGNLSLFPQFDLGKWELTAGWNFGPPRAREEGRWGVEVTYTKEVYGDNTLQGDGVQLGLTRTF